jgi:hypothetical protein
MKYHSGIKTTRNGSNLLLLYGRKGFDTSVDNLVHHDQLLNNKLLPSQTMSGTTIKGKKPEETGYYSLNN